MMKKLVVFFTKKEKIKPNPEDGFYMLSYSQEGEDMVLSRLFGDKKSGTFVDIGAHHPFRFSNTYFFYKKGWRGINVDPLPNSKELFDKHRPEDTNLCIGVSSIESQLNYFMFNEPALNTFSETEAHLKNGLHDGKYYIIDKIKIQTKKLSTILDEYLSSKEIDFLSIDVEGLDMEVLESNDWERYRPKVILVEELRNNITTIIENSNIYHFLKNKGYSLYYRTFNTSFYVDNNCDNK